jgi:hypothetical protein
MLIDLGMACAWLAMSAAGAGVLVALRRLASPQLAAPAEETPEPTHEDFYATDSLPAVAELWR